MLTVATIQNLAQTFDPDSITITDPKAIAAMRKASAIIGGVKSGVVYEIAAAAYTGGVWNDNLLPANHLGILGVKWADTNGASYDYTAYKVRGRDVLFSNSETFIIQYRAVPTAPTTIDSEIEVHEAYLPALEEYLIAYCRLGKWEGEDSMGQALYANFRAQVEDIWENQVSRMKRGATQWTVQRGGA